MKKIISTALMFVILVGSVFALASCALLSGTYKDTISGTTTLEFSGDTVRITTALGQYEAKYEIKDEDGEKTISFTYEDTAKESIQFRGTQAFSEGTEDGVSYIKIGGFKYEKQK